MLVVISKSWLYNLSKSAQHRFKDRLVELVCCVGEFHNTLLYLLGIFSINLQCDC